MSAAPASQTASLRPAVPRGRVAFFLFLGTEVMLFAAILSAYLIARVSAGPSWPSPKSHPFGADFPLMKIHLGAMNTILLLTTSALVATGASFLRRDRLRGALNCFSVALFLGFAFLGVKLTEYQDKIHHGLLPATADQHLPLGRLWSSYYFGLTGLHALHVVAGLLALALLVCLGVIGRLAERQMVLAANVSTYWHLVDAVWLILFPLLYLL